MYRPVKTAYPIFLDVARRSIVIVGGGGVGTRKARSLLECGASAVRAVSLKFNSDFPGAIPQTVAAYSPSHLDGAALVFAATDDPAVNDAIVSDAERRGALVCRADVSESQSGDFFTPAFRRRGESALCVSAPSPKLAAEIRDALLTHWRPEWDDIARLMIQWRPRILAAYAGDAPRRRAALVALADVRAVDRAGSPDGLSPWMIGQFPELLRD